jgi:ribosome-binding factor A
LILSSVKDPRVGFVTITEVDVARDLETAKVYYSVMGDDEEREQSRQGLISAKRFLRKSVGAELKLKNSPDLRFIYDDSLDRSMRIEEAIKEVHHDDEENPSDA